VIAVALVIGITQRSTVMQRTRGSGMSANFLQLLISPRASSNSNCASALAGTPQKSKRWTLWSEGQGEFVELLFQKSRCLNYGYDYSLLERRDVNLAALLSHHTSARRTSNSSLDGDTVQCDPSHGILSTPYSSIEAWLVYSTSTTLLNFSIVSSAASYPWSRSASS